MPKRWTLLTAALTVAAAVTPIMARAPFIAQAFDATAAPDPVLMAAGDVARCQADSGDEATAKIIQNEIDENPATRVAMLGDAAYPNGTIDDYKACYGPSWGAFKDKTYPITGNHDYVGTGSARKAEGGYFEYFADRLAQLGPAAGDPTKGYYSFDIGAWHVISLVTDCGGVVGECGANSPMGQWLKADLAATQAKCMIAMWHAPRFFSAADGFGPTPDPSSDGKMAQIWRVLQAAGADIVLSGHDHIYDRFARMGSPAGGPEQGVVDPTGMRQFVVGTGGGALQPFAAGKPVPTGNEFRADKTYGVLKLTLHQTSYDFQFITTDGTILDHGEDQVCRDDIPSTSTSTYSGTIDTTPGTTPATAPAATSTTTTAPQQVSPRTTRTGYWMVGADGKVFNFGAAKHLGDATGLPAGVEATDLEPTPTGDGYWVVDSGGGVKTFGDAVFKGAPDSFAIARGERVTSLSATPSGAGYWMFTDRGRVLIFGDAVHYGDMAKAVLNGPVLDSIPTPSGKGYYMVASDGGIFAFGDAKFYGSMGNAKLNAPVQSLVPDSDGIGYWLVASDGGIFAFDAPFKGSMGAKPLSKPVTGMVRYADGYLMVGEDGGIFNFSTAQFLGSLGNNPPARPIVSVAALAG